jgi:hypothetical protein
VDRVLLKPAAGDFFDKRDTAFQAAATAFKGKARSPFGRVHTRPPRCAGPIERFRPELAFYRLESQACG